MNERRLTLGSLFSGSGGFELAGLLAGIRPLWASEIEPFPILVTTKRLPQMRHYGDVSTLNGARLPPVDIITFGSPCQDLSVAGKRAGIRDGERSSLFFQAVRIVREMREATNGKYPRYIVWENVPGALSSNKGEDFRAVLDAIIGIKAPGASVPAPVNGRWPHADLYLGDGWSLAYRMLDAQYWGVPQRRRRIFLVADFGGERAGEILFEPEGVSRDPRPRRTPWQRFAGDASAGFDPAGGDFCINPQGQSGIDVTDGFAGTLVAQDHGNHPAVLSAGFIGGNSVNIGYAEEQSPTLVAGGSRDVVTYSIGADHSEAMLSDNPHAGIYEADKARTLDINGGRPDCNQGGMAVVYPIEGNGQRPSHGGSGWSSGESMYTLNATEQHGVAVCSSTTGSYMASGKEVAQTLMARDYKDPQIVSTPEYVVRRLTPTECARLQGFPDGWAKNLETENPTEDEVDFWVTVFETHRSIVTHAKHPKTRKQVVKWLRQPHTDRAEYAMWGNGVALPCVYFVLRGVVGAGRNF